MKDLIVIKSKKINKESIIFTEKTRIWCTLPYPNHKRGCPNFNKNSLCPPHIKIMKSKLDNYNFFYLIYAIFDLKTHKKRMYDKHPEWSERQASCLLYWQNSVKKHLKDFIFEIFSNNPYSSFYLFGSGSGFNGKKFKQDKVVSMEAAGINVIKTVKLNEINIEVRPFNIVHLFCLLCSSNPIKI